MIEKEDINIKIVIATRTKMTTTTAAVITSIKERIKDSSLNIVAKISKLSNKENTREMTITKRDIITTTTNFSDLQNEYNNFILFPFTTLI